MHRWTRLLERKVLPHTTVALVLGVFGALATIAAFWLLSLHGYALQRRDLEAQTWLRAGQVSRAVAVQVQTLLAGLDHTMRGLQSVYATGDMRAFDLAVETALDAYPDGAILQVLVADPQGRVVYSSLHSPGDPPVGASIREREHFQVHARNQAVGMFVGHVVQGGPDAGRRRIPLSRSLQRDGAFAGVLVLALSPGYVGRSLQEIFSGPQEIITLVRHDGAYLARSHDLQQVLGRTMAPQQLQQLAPDAQHGAYQARSSIDQVQRFYAWSRVRGYPLVASAGLDRQGVFASLEKAHAYSMERNGVLTLLLLAGLSMIVWLARQRQRSDALRQSEARHFAQLVQEVPGTLFQYRADAAGRLWLSYASPGFFQDHGMEPSDAPQLAADLLHNVHPEDVSMLRASLYASVAGASSWECNYRIGAPDGPVRWMHAHAQPHREGDGTWQWHGYVHDVTQERVMLETVRQSEERLRLTVGAVGDGLWQWDCASDRVAWDARCFEMLGLRPDALDMSYEAFIGMLHPLDTERLQQSLRQHVDAGTPFRLDVRLRAADGSWRWIETRGEVMQRHADGRAQRMLGTHTDVQQRVEREQLLGALLDRGNALILLTSPERHVLYANERAARVFGLVAGTQPPGLSVRRIYLNEPDFVAMAEVKTMFGRQSTVRMERPLRIADGSAHWFDMQGSLLHPEEGRGNAIWTLTDIDERHRAVAALAQAQQRLNALVNRFPAGILVADAGLRIVAANRTLVAILQIAVDDVPGLAGMPLDAFIGRLPVSVGGLVDALQPAQGDVANKTLRVLPDGQHFEIEAMALRAEGQAIGHCWVIGDVTERSRRESRLQAMALTDSLTGVPNRRAFMVRLEDELGQLRQPGAAQAALIMIDIDFFKRINDSHGHAVGDLALKQLAATLVQGLRRQDMVGRMGGEEFAVLLSNADMQTGMRRAESLRQAVADTQVLLPDGQAIRMTISLGVCALQPGDLGAAAYLERADAALYFSKRTGRNRSTQWSPALPCGVVN